jgi:Tfp pilus assembly protein PilF
MAIKIFISYSQDTKPIASMLGESLEKDGSQVITVDSSCIESDVVFNDRKYYEEKKNWKKWIDDSIETSSIIVLVIGEKLRTDKCNEYVYIKALEEAWSKPDKAILSIIDENVKNSDIPAFLNNYCMLRSDNETKLIQLIKSIINNKKNNKDCDLYSRTKLENTGSTWAKNIFSFESYLDLLKKGELENKLRIRDEIIREMDNPISEKKSKTEDLLNLAMLEKEANHLDKAYALLMEVKIEYETRFGKDNPKKASLYKNIGYVLKDLGDFENARKYFESALEIDCKKYPNFHPKIARDAENLGLLLRSMGEFEKAKNMLERSLLIREKEYGSDHPEVARALINLGSVLESQGKFKEAEKKLDRALRMEEVIYGPDDSHVAEVLCKMGSVLQSEGKVVDAKKKLERALKIIERIYGSKHKSYRKIKFKLDALQEDRYEDFLIKI